jgi:hypothetical protein
MINKGKMRKITVILLFGTLVLSKVGAQQMFYSQSLQNLFWSLPETCIGAVYRAFTDTVVLCREVVEDEIVPLAFGFDENKFLEHIGYRFFPAGDTAALHSVAAVRFIERELLRLLATNDISPTLATYRENSISILLNDEPIKQSILQDKRGFLNLLKTNQGIAINYIDRKKYEVSLFLEKKQKLSFYFPADSELMTDGMYKTERDAQLAFQLKNHKAKSAATVGVVQPDSNRLQLICDTIKHDTIYVDKGNMYLIPQINNDIFYRKKDGIYSLVFDSSRLAETFSNALLVTVNKAYTINVTHRAYGKPAERYTVSNHNFDDYFSCSYDRYFGIETVGKERLTGALILADRNTGNIHLAQITITPNDLLNGGTMEMQLSSNIPMQKVKSLFGKNENEYKEIKLYINNRIFALYSFRAKLSVERA